MKRFRSTIAMSVIAFALIAGTAGEALAAADNSAVAINDQDDSYVWRQAVKITRVNQDTADVGNGAVASASCARCRTVAVAVQVVLITRDASVVTPTNFAFAYNDGCITACATYAGAWQIIVTTRTPVHFTEAGNERIDAFREHLRTLITSAGFGPDLTQIQAFNDQVDQLVDTELMPVVEREVVHVGGGSVDQDTTEDLAA